MEDYSDLEEEYLNSQRVKYKIKYMKFKVNLQHNCHKLQNLLENINDSGWNENIYLKMNNILKDIYEL